jgi:hypothetical protein
MDAKPPEQTISTIKKHHAKVDMMLMCIMNKELSEQRGLDRKRGLTVCSQQVSRAAFPPPLLGG